MAQDESTVVFGTPIAEEVDEQTALLFAEAEQAEGNTR